MKCAQQRYRLMAPDVMLSVVESKSEEARKIEGQRMYLVGFVSHQPAASFVLALGFWSWSSPVGKEPRGQSELHRRLLSPTCRRATFALLAVVYRDEPSMLHISPVPLYRGWLLCTSLT